MSIIIHRPTDEVPKRASVIGVIALDENGDIHVTDRAFDILSAEFKKLKPDEDYED